MASPSAIRRRIEASEAPLKTVSTVRTSKPQRSISLMAAVAALRSAGVAAVSEASRWSAGMAPDECSPPSAWAARIRTAASPLARRMSASASSSACRTLGTGSFLIASSTTDAAPASAWYPSFRAAPRRASGSGLAS